MHAVLPEMSVNLPPGHKSHVDEPPAALNEPGKHSEGAVEPVEHAEPARHGVHALAFCSPGASEYEPDGHGSSAAAPSPQ